MGDLLNDSPKRIFSWKQLIGVMVACGLTLVLLMPDDPTLLEDLIRDGKIVEARRVLDKVSPQAREADALRYALAEQRIARLELAEDADSADYESYIVRANQRWRDKGFSSELLAIWEDDLLRLDALGEAWSALTSDWELLPVSSQARLTETLVRVALGVERADAAAILYAQTYGSSPELAENAMELARLYRLAGDPRRALEAIENTRESRVFELRIALLRELNSNDRALAELLREYKGKSELNSDEVLRLITIARSAGQPDRAISLAQKFLQSRPDDLEVWRGLVMVLRESGRALEAATSQSRVVVLSDRDPSELREHGRLLEGAGMANEAFDVWIELSLQGDRAALDRLVALNPGLFRDRELADVLLALVPVENHADYTLILAKLLTNVGRYDEAVSIYELYFEEVPADKTAMIELAVLETELYRYDEASKWLQRAKAEGDLSPTTRRKLGDAWVAIGEYDLALVEYREVAEQTGLVDDFGSYFRLARSVGAYDDFVAGLEGVIQSEEAEASDYLTLAYGYQLLGDEDNSRVALRQGMKRFPQNAEMPMRLAYAYSDEKRYRDAQDVLVLHPRLGDDVEPTRLYLILMRLNEDAAAETAFLSRKLSKEVWADPESKQHIARIHSLQGRPAEAERLLRELHDQFRDDWEITADLIYALQLQSKNKEAEKLLKPLLREGTAEAWRLAADVAVQLGDYGKAETYQNNYLKLVDPIAATDWGALGDIRLSRGDRIGSKRAYTRALREIQLSLLSEPSREAQP